MNTKGMGTGTPHWLSAFPRLGSIADAGWMEAVNAAREIILQHGAQAGPSLSRRSQTIHSLPKRYANAFGARSATV